MFHPPGNHAQFLTFACKHDLHLSVRPAMGRASRLPSGPFEMLHALLRILIAPGKVDVALNVVGAMLDCRDIARLTVFRQKRGMAPVFLFYQPL